MALPCREAVPSTSRGADRSINDNSNYLMRRKPLARPPAGDLPSHYEIPIREVSRADMIEYEEEVVGEARPILPPRPGLSREMPIPSPYIDSDVYHSPERTNTTSTTFTDFSDSSRPSLPPRNSTTNTSLTTTTSQSQTPSVFKKAYEETMHAAGGIIARPTTSNKHLSILRHSHGLVFYRGPSTTLAISVFSDAHLPPRRLYLQRKGWSGNTGMWIRARAGFDSSWIDVTPTQQVEAAQVDIRDERAWQRDIKSFEKKKMKGKRKYHALRETLIVRLPAEAGDGYFALVMCADSLGTNGDEDGRKMKKKIMLTSPTFRLLSTSMSPSSVRGASLSTLPLELGALAFATYARTTVGNKIAPVTSAVKGQISSYMPSNVSTVAGAAYNYTGASSKLDDMMSNFQNNLLEPPEMDGFLMDSNGDWDRVDASQGPRPPYPVDFDAQCEDYILGEDYLPIMVLKVSSTTATKFHGYYFGWVRLLHSKSESSQWVQSLLSAVLPSASKLAKISIANASKKTFSIKLIEDIDGEFGTEEKPIPVNIKVEVKVMGFIRADTSALTTPAATPTPQQEYRQQSKRSKSPHYTDANPYYYSDTDSDSGDYDENEDIAQEEETFLQMTDISLAQHVLSLPSYQAIPQPIGFYDSTGGSLSKSTTEEQKVGKMKQLKKTFKDKKTEAHQQFEKVPFHKLGIRMPAARGMEKGVVNGFFIVR